MAKTGSERTTAWRQALVGAGYKQKALLLPPQAIKDIKSVRDRFGSESDAEAVALALRRLVERPSNAAPKKKARGK